MSDVYDDMVNGNRVLREGYVRCRTCKKIAVTNSAKCLRAGWPKCCGYTMELVDSEKLREENKEGAE